MSYGAKLDIGCIWFTYLLPDLSLTMLQWYLTANPNAAAEANMKTARFSHDKHSHISCNAPSLLESSIQTTGLGP